MIQNEAGKVREQGTQAFTPAQVTQSIHQNLMCMSDQDVRTSIHLRTLARELLQIDTSQLTGEGQDGEKVSPDRVRANSTLKVSKGAFFETNRDRDQLPNNTTKRGTIYHLLGVHHFQKLLMSTFGRAAWHGVAPSGGLRQGELKGWSNYRMNQDVEGMRDFIIASYFNEVLHSIIGVMNLAVLPSCSGTLAAINALSLGINVYCALLQRYNRARIYPVIERLEARKRSNHNHQERALIKFTFNGEVL